MACQRCSSPCRGRYCSTCQIVADNEGTDETEGTQRTIESLREASHLKAKTAGESGGDA